MSVTPHNVFSSTLAGSVGRHIQAYTDKGLVVEGYLRDVDSSDNILLKNGYVYWFLDKECHRNSFKELMVKGADLVCFNAQPNQTSTNQKDSDALPKEDTD